MRKTSNTWKDRAYTAFCVLTLLMFYCIAGWIERGAVMLQVMLLASVAMMVVLVMRLRRHRAVAHQMWVREVNMEFEIDRLRGLVGRNTVTLGAATAFDMDHAYCGKEDYLDHVLDAICHDFGQNIATGIRCYVRPLLQDAILRVPPHYQGQLQFRMPCIRTDFTGMTCDFVSPFCAEPIPVLTERDHERDLMKAMQDRTTIEDALKSLHVDTDWVNKQFNK